MGFDVEDVLAVRQVAAVKELMFGAGP